MSRRIVVCLDGTGNEIEKNESNILRLYKTLERSEDQILYYSPGVGTINARPFAQLTSKPALIRGLIFGKGLEENILRAYEFLCRHHKEGDRLYFFGYSRGAYTARALAGFINDFGLVNHEEFHLVAPVFRAWRTLNKSSKAEDYRQLRIFEHAFEVRHPAIRFLGLWDTVSSLIRLKWDNGTFFNYGTHSSVDENPSVQTIRHVLAIDETRRFFRHQDWTPGQTYYGNRFKSKNNPPAQDVKQVWFAGTHTDVAGSVIEAESGLTKITLNWMREELDALDVDRLAFRETRYKRYVLGVKTDFTRKHGIHMAPPDANAPLHSQMKNGWFALEWLPRKRWRSRWPDLKSLFGYYIPWGQYRYIPPDAEIHPSALERRNDPSNDYDPPNLRSFK